MSRIVKIFMVVALCPLLSWGQQKAEPVKLPNGWNLTPAGIQYPLGDLPLNMAVSPNKRWLAVTNNGYGRQCIQIFDIKNQRMTSDQTVKCSWYGLCFGPKGDKIYASAGNDNAILCFNFSKQGKITPFDTIRLGKPWPTQISPAGIGVCGRTNQLFVGTRHDNSLYIYDLPANSSQKGGIKFLKKIPLGGKAYDVLISKDQQRVYISCWSCEEVKVWNIAAQQWEKSYKVGTHPNELCFDNKGKRLFVANAEDNTVSVINLLEKRVEETLNAAPYESHLEGSTTNGLAISPNNKTLAIANADNNCLTLFDISQAGQSRALGFIPTGWYPTNVRWIGKQLLVTNGKGLTSKPNPRGPQPMNNLQNFGHHTGDRNKKSRSEYIAGLFLGALSVIEQPDEKTLQEYTKEVFQNTPYKRAQELTAEGEDGNPIPQRIGDPSPIKHVFYIIKENRTYDQVLGDMKEGNGDSALCLFGEKYTPNLHKISRDFVLLDNFYVNAEVSCDGHNWTMGAYANDYLEKTWPSSYSGRGDVYSAEGYYYMGNNKSGFFWDNCLKHGVSYRDYGEFAHRTKDGIAARNAALKGYVCQTFEPWNLNVYDTVRVRQWIADFDSLVKCNAVPQFQTVRFGGDHTQGMQLGKMTPYVHAADNDLAVGLFLEHLSQSPIWQESAVFVVEDDAQNGADHVDAHRSTAYVAGGYVKSGYVDHTPYATTSMLRTMELILGLPPMTQYDASSRSMWRCFSKDSRHTPYNHVSCNIDLTERNEKRNKWQAMSEGFNFNKEDDVPDMEFNKVIWHGLKGDSATYPPLRRSAFLSYKQGDEDDDDD